MSFRFRVLVAEDDQNIRDLIRTRLAMAGYEVRTARTGAEALSQIPGFRPQAMVLDINMPVLDGFGVLEEVQARDIRLPTLVLTARHAAEDVRRALGLGAKDYLAKPFTEQQLITRVARLLRPAPALAPAQMV